MPGTIASLAEQAGSRVEITDERAAGTPRQFRCNATLTAAQRAAVAELTRHDLGMLVAPPGSGEVRILFVFDPWRSAILLKERAEEEDSQ
jgi:hypothetical protein